MRRQMTLSDIQQSNFSLEDVGTLISIDGMEFKINALTKTGLEGYFTSNIKNHFTLNWMA